MPPATNFAARPLRAPFDQHKRGTQGPTSSGDKALNQRIDSPPREAARIAMPQLSIFFSATRRILRRSGVFQLPSATFPLRACGRGCFSDQKFRLARNEQTEPTQRSSTRAAFAKARPCARRTFARSCVELGGDDKKDLARAKAGQSDGHDCRKKIISRAWRSDATDARPYGLRCSCASRPSAPHA
jgi:hypothetical protein